MTKETFIYGLNACPTRYHNGQKFYEHDELVKCFEDLGMFEQEPFMNKSCVAHQICHEDKVKVLDKIRAEIEEVQRSTVITYQEYKGLRAALKIINKYAAESEARNDSNN